MSVFPHVVYKPVVQRQAVNQSSMKLKARSIETLNWVGTCPPITEHEGAQNGHLWGTSSGH